MSNNGLIRERIILLDLFELGESVEKLRKDIVGLVWERRASFKKLPGRFVSYFRKKAEEKFTLKNVEKFWEMG
ncbi:MAG: hypothetical protein ABIG28_01150 [archaeon]